MSDTGVSVGRWPGAADDYRIMVTATRRRDRGRKTLELRAFERNPATGAWSVEPGHRRIMDRATDLQTGAADALAHTYSRRVRGCPATAMRGTSAPALICLSLSGP